MACMCLSCAPALAQASIAISDDYLTEKVYDKTPAAVPTAAQMAISGGSYGDVSFTWSDAAGQTLSSAPVNAGGYTLTASLPGGAAAHADYIIKRRPIQISGYDMTVPYGLSQEPEREPAVSTQTPLMPGDELVGELECEYSLSLGRYPVLQGTVTNENNPNYDIEYLGGCFTVCPAAYQIDVLAAQALTQGACRFVEPTFMGREYDDVRPMRGTLTYALGDESGLTYAQTVERLNACAPGTQTITYTFDIDENGNYCVERDQDTQELIYDAVGTITLTVQGTAFFVGGQPVGGDTRAAVIKDSPIYGDTWGEILGVHPQLAANTGDQTDGSAANFFFQIFTVDEFFDPMKEMDAKKIPDVGEYAWQMMYRAGSARTTNVIVDHGTVTVARRPVIAVAEEGSLWWKSYDGTRDSSFVSSTHSVRLEGLAPGDEGDVKVETELSPYPDQNIGEYPATLKLSLWGWKAPNYLLTNPEMEVTAYIIAQELLIEQKGFKVSKVYDGTTAPGTGSGALDIRHKEYVIAPGEASQVWLEVVIPPYDDPNVGAQTSMKVELRLAGEKAGNYVIDEWYNPLEVPCEITQNTDQPQILVTGTYEYTGSEIIPAFSVVRGAYVLPEDEYTVRFEDNVMPGTARILVDVASNPNYAFSGQIEETFVIEKLTACDTFQFETPAIEKTAADLAFTVTPAGLPQGVTIAGYASSNPEVAVVDDTGRVQIIGPGVTVITVTTAESDIYAAMTISYTLSVAGNETIDLPRTGDESHLMCAVAALALSVALAAALHGKRRRSGG